MKKLRPILFSTPMVQAILEGRKTQTRRVVKPQPITVNTGEEGLSVEQFKAKAKELEDLGLVDIIHGTGGHVFPKCPYGKVGDVLWVRESCFWVMRDHAHDLLEGAKDNNQWVYKASVNDDFITYAKEKYSYKWRPSIHMPFDAARIFLEITNVRVERLQNISPSDAKNEGIAKFTKDKVIFKHGLDGWNWSSIGKFPHMSYSYPGGFSNLWIHINGEESWNANPWVWVVEFKRITREEATS